MSRNYEKIESLFVDLMACTIQEVIDKIKSGEADSKDVRNALTLLKDNGFTLRDVPSDKKPEEFLDELAQAFPALPNISSNGEIIEADLEDD